MNYRKKVIYKIIEPPLYADSLAGRKSYPLNQPHSRPLCELMREKRM